MATWFATATGYINSAGRWNSLPNGTGTALAWPAASGDVLMANGFNITVNVSTNLGATGELRNDTANGATAGGFFQTANGVSVTANIYAGSGLCFYVFTGITNYLVGNVYGGSSSTAYGVQTLGNLIFTGNAYGGSVSGAIGLLLSGGSLSVTGNINAGSIANGMQTGGTVTSCTITGDIIGGESSTASGLLNNTTANITHTGNVIAGTSGTGIYNVTTGSITTTGYAQASSNVSGITNTVQGVVSVGETRSASNGRSAVSGAFRYASTTALIHKQIAADGSVLTMKPVGAFTMPDEAAVRNNVRYGADKTGTLTGCNRHHRMSI